MKLKNKVFLLTAMVLLITIGALYLLLSEVALNKFNQLEQENVLKDIESVHDSMIDDTASLDANANDYASWDATYDFVQGLNENYSVTDANIETMQRLKLNYFVVSNISDDVIFLMASNEMENATIEPAQSIVDFFSKNTLIFHHAGLNSSISGFLSVPGGYIIFASRPVLRSSGEGPLVGSLVIARLLDRDDIERLISKTHVNFSIIGYYGNYYNGSLSPDESNMVLTREHPTIVKFLDMNTIVGYYMMYDVYGNPSFIIKSVSDRRIYAEAKNTLLYILLYSLGAAVLAYIIFASLISKLVVRRISGISNEINEIARSNDISKRVTVEYSDEISSLARTLNSTLESLEKLSNEKDAIFKAVSESFFHVDADCNLLGHMNPSQPSAIRTGNTLEEFFPGDALKDIRSSTSSAISSGRMEVVEYAERIGSDSQYYEARIVPMKNREASIIVHNITSHKANEEYIRSRNAELEKSRIAAINIMEDLAESNSRLKELDQAKSDFINVASHELKTPLTAISAYLDILEDFKNNFNPEQLQMIDAIKRNSNHLKTIINNILEVSRVESGKFELNVTEIDPAKKIRMELDNLKVLSDSKGIGLRADIAELPRMRTDEMRFEEILNNLLSNAIKFTEKGGVTLTAVQSGSNIKIMVTDTGIGIPKDKMDRLFQNFYQADQSVARKFGGSGLGLAITKKMVEAMGGSVDVESVENVGSTFTVLLPIDQQSKEYV